MPIAAIPPCPLLRTKYVKTLTSPSLLYLKAGLMVAAGSLAAVLLVVRSPSLVTAVLIAIAVWAFCRAYYFAFYVIERYVDPAYRFSGLWTFVQYVSARRKQKKARTTSGPLKL